MQGATWHHNERVFVLKSLQFKWKVSLKVVKRKNDVTVEVEQLELTCFAQNYIQRFCQCQELNPYTRCLMPEPQPQGYPIFFNNYFIINKIYCAIESLSGLAHNHLETLHPTYPGSHIFTKLKQDFTESFNCQGLMVSVMLMIATRGQQSCHGMVCGNVIFEQIEFCVLSCFSLLLPTSVIPALLHLELVPLW